MSDITIARRYAQALNEQAAQSGVFEQVDADIDLINQSLADSRDLRNFFASPIISREKKADVVSALFKESVQAVTMTFLGMLVDKRREDLFPAVVSGYRELRDAQLGVAPVSVRTAYELSSEDQDALLSSLKTMIGKDVRLETKVDASILGGIVIRVGDTVYDGSITNQLATLRERLEMGAPA